MKILLALSSMHGHPMFTIAITHFSHNVTIETKITLSFLLKQYRFLFVKRIKCIPYIGTILYFELKYIIF